MPPGDRARWNERHAAREHDLAPAASLVALRSLLQASRRGAQALDLACGTGRNALYLAELGYRVDAWDISDVALRALEAELEHRKQGGQRLAVHPRQLDLDSLAHPNGCPLSDSGFDLIIDYYYLDREPFAQLRRALRPGGVLIVETFLDCDRGRQLMRNPEYRLRPGELGRAFSDLEMVEQVEDEGEGIARLVGRRPAPNG